jgi:hypothetical protein
MRVTREEVKSVLKKPNEPIVSLYSLISIVVSIILYVFMETTLFSNLQNFWKVIIYITVLILSILFGRLSMNIFGFQTKELLGDLKVVIEDRTLKTEEKLNKILAIVVRGCTLAGEYFDILNSEQFGGSNGNSDDNRVNSGGGN